MSYSREQKLCQQDGVVVEDSIDNWPDGQGGLITVDKCRLTGSICDAFHCPKSKTLHPGSHYDALEAVGLTEAYAEEIG